MSSNGICIYRNCTDAHRHGRYDIPLGDPEYCPAQDRDNDGVACES
ncbi:excalibur calcium-binding domain-containing protein [Mycobacterium marinum]|nr:excalibur calcium-binding domain-containing protein [Mycobacterium marinum]MDC8973842.1 excalibur calcium-binding domain-containing protein [Mycobacterium marinum]MDC8982330.1 excalibur calcium-binding domain-containing protein [Mycobacterium marinum]MDC8994794.1 excalibur calcium-binding domain-containing protein [Mycobacterium marinum]MDC9000391.1 excalibur calcium-binding domain-containing protein [Mycobacterium marinum]MDC9004296.1 excalibur calcium-binding domain-containing protein [My